MRIELGFDKGRQGVELPARNVMAVLQPCAVDVATRGEAEVRRALSEPIASPRLRDLLHAGETVAIVTSDLTRPMPTSLVMPPLLEELYAAGIRKEDITLVFALGSHRGHTAEEQRKLAGEQAYHEIRCLDSDPADCLCLGRTRRGTPAEITRVVAEADRRICLGNIEYHYFAGYSGGAKALMPGVSTRTAIQSNHRLMVEAGAVAGRLDGNPVREDLEEAAALCGADFIVNVVLDEHKEIVRTVAGEVTAAHRAGCAFLDKMYLSPIPGKADIVLVSQGGAPKDLNLYQTQKALDNAGQAVKEGGVVILVGACREGFGEAVFEEWMTRSPSPDYILQRIQEDFQLGGHKAAAIALVLAKAEIYLVSQLPPSVVRSIFMQPYDSAQRALNDAFAKRGRNAKVLVMPYGGSTLPRISAQKKGFR